MFFVRICHSYSCIQASVTGRRIGQLQEVTAECNLVKANSCQYVKSDVTSNEECERMIAEANKYEVFCLAIHFKLILRISLFLFPVICAFFMHAFL